MPDAHSTSIHRKGCYPPYKPHSPKTAYTTHLIFPNLGAPAANLRFRAAPIFPNRGAFSARARLARSAQPKPLEIHRFDALQRALTPPGTQKL